MSTGVARGGGWGKSSQIALRAKKMRDAGSSIADIAKQFGVSYPTASKAVKKGEERIRVRQSQASELPGGEEAQEAHQATAVADREQEYVVKLVKGAVFVSEATRIEGVSPEDALKVMRHLESVGLAQIYRLTK